MTAGILPPIENETFSSWVYRCSVASPEISLRLRSPSVKSWSGRFIDEWIYEDPDFDVDSEFLRFAAEDLSLSSDLIEEMVRRENRTVLTWPARRIYCRECLRGDVSRGHLPAWRKEWCYVDSVFCTVHGLQFSCLKHEHDIEKGWVAFSDSALQKGCFSRDFETWVTDPVRAEKHKLLQQIHSWRERRYSEIEIDFDILLNCFELVFSLFLQAPTTEHSGGLGWHISHWGSGRPNLGRYRHSYGRSLSTGVMEAGINERVCALILAGRAFGIISPADIEVLSSSARSFYYPFSYSKEALGHCCSNYNNSDEYLYLMSQFERFPIASMGLLAEFISGVQRKQHNTIAHSAWLRGR